MNNAPLDKHETVARNETDIFERMESNVRYYCRRLPKILTSAKGSRILDDSGNTYVDLLSACGSLNYGHAHPTLKAAAIDFLVNDGVVAGLDFHTSPKRDFLNAFETTILRPRGLDYKLQFPGPTGANCVEAALKLARKVTNRTNVVAFTNGFHGVSLGALAATGSSGARQASAGSLHNVTRLPYEGYHGASIEDLQRFEAMAQDPSGGIDPVAAFIVETVQGEGGLNTASSDWLRYLSAMSKRLGALLIVDDIQAGCGRTGTFFSFERAGIHPDLICLAKSISGFGFPMSLLLLKPECDLWKPGEHNGTFRGNSIAFATAAAALGLWTDAFINGIALRTSILSNWCRSMEKRYGRRLRAKGTGLMQGLRFEDATFADRVAAEAIRRGILLECCGPSDEVVKIMPALNIDPSLLASALDQLGAIISDLFDEMAVATVDDAPSLQPKLQSDQSGLDAGDDGRHAVRRAELTHDVG